MVVQGEVGVEAVDGHHDNKEEVDNGRATMVWWKLEMLVRASTTQVRRFPRMPTAPT